MAQVDFTNYFPILFWFFILFFIFYWLNYSYILPYVYIVLLVRGSYYMLKFYKVKRKFSFFNKHKANKNSITNVVFIKLGKKSELYNVAAF
jgi:hypothetical protein